MAAAGAAGLGFSAFVAAAAESDKAIAKVSDNERLRTWVGICIGSVGFDVMGNCMAQVAESQQKNVAAGSQGRVIAVELATG
jgi:hypothetical protein